MAQKRTPLDLTSIELDRCWNRAVSAYEMLKDDFPEAAEKWKVIVESLETAIEAAMELKK